MTVESSYHSSNPEIQSLTEQSQKYADEIMSIVDEVQKVIVGQEDVIKKLVIALMADGHVLLEGVPGLAKTKMVDTISKTLGANFCRIQFTPDLLPADIVGTKIYDNKNEKFVTEKGPVFSNLILADEINRAPPKVQSALLEAMQERQVSIQANGYKNFVHRVLLMDDAHLDVVLERDYRSARRGRVSLAGRVLSDDEGPLLAVGASLFWAAWAYKHDRARLERRPRGGAGRRARQP